MSCPVGKDILLDAVGRQFEPYLTARCVCMLEAPLWCDLGCCSRTVVVIKAAANPRLYWALVRMRQPSVIWRLHSWNAASEATSTRERRAERTARYLGAISHPGSCWKTSTLMIGIERSRARGAKQRIQSRGCSRQPLGRGSTWNKSKVNDTIGT